MGAQDLRVFDQQHYPIQVKLCILEDARESRVISSSLRDDRENHMPKVRPYAVMKEECWSWSWTECECRNSSVNYISHPNVHAFTDSDSQRPTY